MLIQILVIELLLYRKSNATVAGFGVHCLGLIPNLQEFRPEKQMASAKIHIKLQKYIKINYTAAVV